MTPLLTQLIPFNRTNPLVAGPYTVDFNRFNGQRAFHTSIGILLAEGEMFESVDNANFNIRMGTTLRKEFNERWVFYRGFDGYLAVGSFNLIGDNRTEAVVIGLGPRWCMEYRISPAVGLSVESALVLGIDTNTGTADFRFIPPVAVNLNFILPRKS